METAEQIITLKFVGKSPFLMHNNQAVSPINPYSIEIKRKSGKKKKTQEDHSELFRLEWEAGLYLSDGEVKIPMRLVNKCLEQGAKKKKNGALWKSGCIILDDYCDFDYAGPKIRIGKQESIPEPKLDPHYAAHAHQMPVRVGTSSIIRTRPVFEGWSLQVRISYDPNTIDRDTVITAAEDAGKLVGLGDWRIEKGGSFGRFGVEVLD